MCGWNHCGVCLHIIETFFPGYSHVTARWVILFFSSQYLLPSHTKHRQFSNLKICVIFASVCDLKRKKKIKLSAGGMPVSLWWYAWGGLSKSWCFSLHHCIWIWCEGAGKKNAPQTETIEHCVWRNADAYVNKEGRKIVKSSYFSRI